MNGAATTRAGIAPPHASNLDRRHSPLTSTMAAIALPGSLYSLFSHLF